MSVVDPGLDGFGELVVGPPPSTHVGARRRGRPQIWRVVIFMLAAVFFLVPLAAAF